MSIAVTAQAPKMVSASIRKLYRVANARLTRAGLHQGRWNSTDVLVVVNVVRLAAPLETMRKRVGARNRDASRDLRREVLEQILNKASLETLLVANEGRSTAQLIASLIDSRSAVRYVLPPCSHAQPRRSVPSAIPIAPRSWAIEAAAIRNTTFSAATPAAICGW
jgi:hypothetical protein